MVGSLVGNSPKNSLKVPNVVPRLKLSIGLGGISGRTPVLGAVSSFGEGECVGPSHGFQRGCRCLNSWFQKGCDAHYGIHSLSPASPPYGLCNVMYVFYSIPVCMVPNLDHNFSTVFGFSSLPWGGHLLVCNMHLRPLQVWKTVQRGRPKLPSHVPQSESELGTICSGTEVNLQVTCGFYTRHRLGTLDSVCVICEEAASTWRFPPLHLGFQTGVFFSPSFLASIQGCACIVLSPSSGCSFPNLLCSDLFRNEHVIMPSGQKSARFLVLQRNCLCG